MTNLHTTTALTEFAPLSPEQEQSSVGSFFAKVFNFKTSPTDDNGNNGTATETESVVNNVNMLTMNYIIFISCDKYEYI